MGRRGRERRFHAPFAGLAELLPAAAVPAGGRGGDGVRGGGGNTVPQDCAASAAADAALFAAATHGTRILGNQPPRLAPPRAAREAASDEQLALAELEELVAGDGPFRITDSEEVHTGLAPGVSYALLARLRRGEFAFHQHLDLHGMNREVAHRELARFVVRARRQSERCVLVITGRGKSSPAGLAVLREALPRWLSRAPLRPHVLAFCTARPSDGGPGAFYLLLRRAGVRPYGTDVT